MFKKLAVLQSQLQIEKEQLEKDIKALQTTANNSDSETFSELVAASRITSAKSKDHLEGTHTVDAVIQEVNDQREKANQKFKALAEQKMIAKQQLPQKQAQLASVSREMNIIAHKIKNLVNAEAKQRLEVKVKEYRQAASGILNLLIDIDALNAVFTENPNGSPVKHVLGLETLPALGTDNIEDVVPWQIESTGRKLFFTRENAFTVIRKRLESIEEEIRGDLNEK